MKRRTFLVVSITAFLNACATSETRHFERKEGQIYLDVTDAVRKRMRTEGPAAIIKTLEAAYEAAEERALYDKQVAPALARMDLDGAALNKFFVSVNKGIGGELELSQRFERVRAIQNTSDSAQYKEGDLVVVWMDLSVGRPILAGRA